MQPEKLTITPLAAFQDNYIWCLTKPDSDALVVVDPGDADVVLQFARTTKRQLSSILVTHHHWDHTDGIAALKQHWPNTQIIGPDYEAERIPSLTQTVHDGDIVQLEEFDLQFQVLHLPGHTLGHIAYYQSSVDGAPLLFCGDTLFSAGCGRLFEGSPEQMHQSLQRLMALPNETLIYCTHEYTLANLAFARAVEPDNQAVIAHLTKCQQLRDNQLPTLPSKLATEKAINPFLRCHLPDLQRKYTSSSEQAVFTALRSDKDRFKS
ncbi:hydroxyacylglutathione hydrolase [Alkalimonas amylolytica]|uniref:Hydroxyacylglutathione hydrolase n=1 Tax=Alkalimonas amylolytica TaxID=152573 RepID=A0A1H4F0V9_ALKAM|nr:hydroxyacylglutathione hydrolase [Alkalimonas amylolytica]SEA90924.1 hydroxyacylglutathione hydrolase [Alkalimonas amylolytica]